jgi:hypothetical protein
MANVLPPQTEKHFHDGVSGHSFALGLHHITLTNGKKKRD